MKLIKFSKIISAVFIFSLCTHSNKAKANELPLVGGLDYISFCVGSSMVAAKVLPKFPRFIRLNSKAALLTNAIGATIGLGSAGIAVSTCPTAAMTVAGLVKQLPKRKKPKLDHGTSSSDL